MGELTVFGFFRLNAKLGGINTIPDPRSVVDLSDPNVRPPVCPCLMLSYV